MQKRACRCGRILYEDSSTCPSCGRSMSEAPVVSEHKELREGIEVWVQTIEWQGETVEIGIAAWKNPSTS